MFSLCQIMFDTPVDFSSYVDRQRQQYSKCCNVSNEGVPQLQDLLIKAPQTSQEFLFNILVAIIHKYFSLDHKQFESDSWDQLAMFYETLRVIPGGNVLFSYAVGNESQTIPLLSGPSGTIPSIFHSVMADKLLDRLNALPLPLNRSKEWSWELCHEFNGIGNIFPVDIAVYESKKLICFVEVDGSFHYSSSPSHHLRRKDVLKEKIYRHHFPEIPLFRIRDDQDNAMAESLDRMIRGIEIKASNESC